MFKEEWLQTAPRSVLVEEIDNIVRLMGKTKDLELLRFYSDGIKEITDELIGRLEGR